MTSLADLKMRLVESAMNLFLSRVMPKEASPLSRPGREGRLRCGLSPREVSGIAISSAVRAGELSMPLDYDLVPLGIESDMTGSIKDGAQKSEGDGLSLI